MRYAIWDKVSPVITPSGAVFTALQWKEKYPVANLDNISIVCSAGEVNGGVFSTLGQMVESFASRGCDFTGCNTDEEKINKINAFEEEEYNTRLARTANSEANEELTATALASIAASMEYQNMLTLDDITEV